MVVGTSLVRALLCLSIASPLVAAPRDWSNNGGNARRNGLTPAVGPEAPAIAWSGGRSSVIAWQPVIEGSRVYMVRQTGFPPEQTGSPIVCQDLATGAELWTANIPANTGDWTTWIAGVEGGRLYASRSGNGGSVSARLQCFDAATGALLWTSVDAQNGGAYDGVVFAANGDPIVSTHTRIWRFDHATGQTVWTSPRVGSVSGTCGGALNGDAFYTAEVVPGGQAIRRWDANTGAQVYTGPTMNGFLHQTSPMVGPDGTIYLPRVQNSAVVDFMYAFRDTGAAISPLWSRPAGYCYASEFAVAPDNSVYMLNQASQIERVDGATGALLHTSATLVADTWEPRLGVDAMGKVYVSNGGFPNGRFWSFNADLTERWTVAVPNINIGAPAIAGDGTLVVAGVGTNVLAYRTTPSFLSSYCFGDGSGVACPCGNNGAAGRGCASSVNPDGALLRGFGAARLANDTFVLQSSGLPNTPVLFFQGTQQTGATFGDGLRCASGTLVRLGTGNASSGIASHPRAGDPAISVRGGIAQAGQVRHYQAWYRNAAAFCTASTFNLTNGLSATWQP